MSDILVVDDEPGILDSLSLLLADDGHHIDTAQDGVEALEYLREKHYDLVLTDILMPKMDGLQLLDTIRKQWGKLVRVIVISAHANLEVTARVLRAGARDLIIKPFESRVLREAVQSALGRRIDSSETPSSEPPSESSAIPDGPAASLDFTVLQRFHQTLQQSATLDKIGTSLISMLQQILHCDRAMVVIYQRGCTDIRFRCAHPQGSDLTFEDEYLLEWLAKNRRLLFIEDLEKESEFTGGFEAARKQGSLLAIPLKRGFRILGALLLYRSPNPTAPAFSREMLQMLMVLASATSTSIENTELYEDLQAAFGGTIHALMSAVDAKDAYTAGHSVRVARYVMLLADALKLPDGERRRLEYIALLHDMGKIAVPENILQQRDQLSDWQTEILKTHALIGENIIRSIKFLPEGDRIIRHHHESFDGQGYPDGLRGEAIPLWSRMIAIADAFDMMTSDCPCQEKLDVAEAVCEMIRQAGKRFDPELLNLFLRAYAQTNNKPG